MKIDGRKVLPSGAFGRALGTYQEDEALSRGPAVLPGGRARR